MLVSELLRLVIIASSLALGLDFLDTRDQNDRPVFPGLELVVRPCLYIVENEFVFVVWDIPGGLLFDAAVSRYAAFRIGCGIGDSRGEDLGGQEQGCEEKL